MSAGPGFTIEDGALLTPETMLARLRLGEAPELPYTVRITAEWLAGHRALIAGLVSGTSQFQAMFHYKNRTNTGIKGEIYTSADGREVFRWKGEASRLTNNPLWGVGNPKSLFFGTHGSKFRITQIEVYSGDPKRIPAPSELQVAGNDGNEKPKPKENEPTEKPPVQQQPRVAIPTVVARKAAEKQIRDIFKAEFDALKKSPSAEVRRDLIEKLRSQAAELKDDAVSRYVLFQQAGEIAQEEADVVTTLKIADDIIKFYNVDGYELKAESLTECLSNTRLPSLAGHIAQQSLLLSEEATQDDAFDGAGELLKVAGMAALKSKNRTLSRTVTARHRGVLDLKKDFAAAERARETLQTDPDDAAANQKLGTYLCVSRNR